MIKNYGFCAGSGTVDWSDRPEIRSMRKNDLIIDEPVSHDEDEDEVPSIMKSMFTITSSSSLQSSETRKDKAIAPIFSTTYICMSSQAE